MKDNINDSEVSKHIKLAENKGNGAAILFITSFSALGYACVESFSHLRINLSVVPKSKHTPKMRIMGGSLMREKSLWSVFSILYYLNICFCQLAK